MAAKAMTCMPQKLQELVERNFQLNDVRQVSGWFEWVVGKGACRIAEGDCKTVR
jgi:hypothetical protein